MASLRTYIEETVYELTQKVSWPTWEELQTSAVIVLVTCVIMSLLVWAMDYVFGIWPGSWKGVLGFYYSLYSSTTVAP